MALSQAPLPGRCCRALTIAFVAVVFSAQLALAAPFASLVMDARTGEVLEQDNADARLHPASLTKMMTLYIAFQAIKHGEISLDTDVTVSANAAAEPPSKIGLRRGQKIKLRYLIRAAAIKSANDAATAIGEAIGGSESAFAARMTRTAHELGMKNTTFKNAHGLTASGHLSTARDMTILGRHLLFDHPEYYNLFSRQSAYAGITTVTSHNRLLNSYEGADGIKTGFTSAAGFNLVASAKRGNTRIIATVFGGTSTAARDRKVAQLLDLGFKRAPSSAPVVEPEKPSYADAVDPGATAKTLRVVGAPKSSLRPKWRPGQPADEAAPDATMLAAIQDGVNTTLDSVAKEDELDAHALAVAEQAAQAAAQAAAEVAADAGSDLAPEVSPLVPPRRPEDLVTDGSQLALAEDSPLAAVLEAADDPAAKLDAAAAPAGAVDVADTADGEADGGPLEIADVEATKAETIADSVPQPAGTKLATKSPKTGPTGLEMADALPAVDDPDTLGPAAEAGEIAPPEDVAVAEAEPATRPQAPVQKAALAIAELQPEDFSKQPAEPKVVTRLSTSGGRQWGINVGRYPSEYAADLALTKTALTEVTTLSDASRKVRRGKLGFEAEFFGLSQDMAELACMRLSARNLKCSTMGPG